MRKRNGLNVCYRFKCNAIGTIVIDTKYTVRTIGIWISGICHGVVIWSRLLLSEYSMLMQSTEFRSIVMFALRQLQHRPHRLNCNWSRKKCVVFFSSLSFWKQQKTFVLFLVLAIYIGEYCDSDEIVSFALFETKSLLLVDYSVRWGVEWSGHARQKLQNILLPSWILVRFWYFGLPCTLLMRSNQPQS